MLDTFYSRIFLKPFTAYLVMIDDAPEGQMDDDLSAEEALRRLGQHLLDHLGVEFLVLQSPQTGLHPLRQLVEPGALKQHN